MTVHSIHGGGPANVDGPGGGGDDGDMDSRLTALETKWETVIPTLATKTDVEGLKAEIHKGFYDTIKWVVGTVIVLGATGLAVLSFVLNNATPKQPAQPAVQPAPIIIQMPVPAQAPAQGTPEKAKK